MKYPSNDVIEISLKFENIFNDKDDDFCHKNNFNNIYNNATTTTTTINQNYSTEKCNLNFLELSERTLNDVLMNDYHVHVCLKKLLENVLVKKSFNANNIDTSFKVNTPFTSNNNNNNNNITNNKVTVHQERIFSDEDDLCKAMNAKIFDSNLLTPNDDDLKIINRNSSKRSSMKSSKSMETGLERSNSRQKDRSPDESKAKSVGNINNDENNFIEDFENGESIELIFISDEFVNKVQRQQQEVIIVDEKDGKRRESLTNTKKIVIITDQFKQKVLRNNSITHVLTNEKRKMLKKSKKASKTYNTNSNSFLSYDEPDELIEKMESKNFDADVNAGN
jgi:hypothetical protein